MECLDTIIKKKRSSKNYLNIETIAKVRKLRHCEEYMSCRWFSQPRGGWEWAWYEDDMMMKEYYEVIGRIYSYWAEMCYVFDDIIYDFYLLNNVVREIEI